jgi:cytochrome d ubiquinol oxidase subunit I
MAVGDTLARWVYNNQPAKFAAIELVPTTGSDVPETLLGRENANGTISGGIALPGVASFLSDPRTGTSTVVEGRNAFPTDSQPTIAQTNAVHLAWDIMVGLGTLLALLSAWYGLSWAIKHDIPKTRWFLRIAACAGVLAVITMEAGWVVTEVGRQPWIVYNYMRVADAATTNGGVWITFLAIVAIYAVVGVTTILVLRGMSRRWQVAGGGAESDVPYGPSAPPPVEREEVPVG